MLFSFRKDLFVFKQRNTDNLTFRLALTQLLIGMFRTPRSAPVRRQQSMLTTTNKFVKLTNKDRMTGIVPRLSRKRRKDTSYGCGLCTNHHHTVRHSIPDHGSPAQRPGFVGGTLCKTELALMHCNVCHTQLCKDCVVIHFSDKSQAHSVFPIEQFLSTEAKKEIVKKDLQEIENSIFPKYEEVASNIQIQKADQRKNSQKLTADLKKHGEALHKEIDIIIQSKQTELGVSD
uniref:Uncharacterized protein LOC111137978 isoform X1 n=1 Tax=Crassostrea virginica TaxID=6565 RepID=A0A8B8F0W3_CRAVI|nr:uncharacterized protein LOC111137978 isoform X1 [Crassostrea virginica]